MLPAMSFLSAGRPRRGKKPGREEGEETNGSQVEKVILSAVRMEREPSGVGWL
jgi:hypothetical protein